jgi:hypothetical protein
VRFSKHDGQLSLVNVILFSNKLRS